MLSADQRQGAPIAIVAKPLDPDQPLMACVRLSLDAAASPATHWRPTLQCPSTSGASMPRSLMRSPAQRRVLPSTTRQSAARSSAAAGRLGRTALLGSY